MPESDKVKTCENCVRAKIRCANTPDSSICDRRIEALEDKIDQIMDQINPRKKQVYRWTPSSSEAGQNVNRQACDVIGKGLINYELANILLDSYRESMRYFPFIILSGRTTVEDLRAERPFLLLCIFIVTSFQDTPLQRSLEDVLKSYIGDVILHSPHDNHPNALETFQGLLVVLAGYTNFVVSTATFTLH
ncbi:hypothetical protein N7454_000343 [Penicillium verhagenii]|nr:hypothetical protein N7454_000343 [Penicillium verhagenii]